MKNTSNTVFVGALVLGWLAGIAQAATVFNASPANILNDGANWSNGLPTPSTNPGTVNLNSIWNTGSTLTDWHVNFTGGSIGTDSTGTRTFSGGVQTFNGGSLDFSGRAVATTGSADTTVNTGGLFRGGSATITNSTFTVSGGQLVGVNQFGGSGDINVNGTTVFNLNSGTVIAGQNGTAGNFGNNATTPGGVWNLNGGTLTAYTLRYRDVSTMVLGGTTAGSATFTNGWAGTNHTQSNVRINWLTGSLMALTIGVDDWAENEWVANRMFFNGQSSMDFGGLTWADATNSSVGLGGGTYFDWDGSTNTLALAVVPEPSTYALLAGVAGLGSLAVRRHRRCG